MSASNATKSAATATTHVTGSAAKVAANPAANLAATPTGAPAGTRKQKLVYTQAEGTKVKLVPSAAKGSAQRAYLDQLQQAFGKAKTMPSDQLRAALAKVDGVTNPGRVHRRAVRAGILVTA